jgi:hypothetical protein
VEISATIQRCQLKITLRDKHGKPLPERYEVFESINPSLCIHPSVFEPTSIFGQVAEAWTATHVPSGAAVMSLLPSQKVAEAMVDWLTKQPMDWSGDFESVAKSATEEFKRHIQESRRISCAYYASVLDLLEAFDSPLVAEPQETK